jgi:aspartate/methionine/tyrosine aminotransferase
MAIPKMMEHPDNSKYLLERVRHYENLSNLAYNILKDVPYIVVNRTDGAFYMTIVFNEAVLNNNQKLEVKNNEIKEYLSTIIDDRTESDKRFVYYLLAATGICVVPLTSFFTSLPGFRMTLLEKDVDKFEEIVKKLASSIVEYVESAK